MSEAKITYLSNGGVNIDLSTCKDGEKVDITIPGDRIISWANSTITLPKDVEVDWSINIQ